jgi:type I restriction enzyme M protein
MSNTDNKPDIMSYESSIWSTADILRGVSIKKGQWPEFMMPMFALLMVESRIKRHFNELIESNNGSKEMAIEELKEEVEDARTGISNTYGYNSILVEDGKSLSDVASTDANFDAEFERYLEAFDDETRDLLGINPREGDNKLDMRKYLKILDDKNVKFDYVQAWASIDFTNYNNSEITTLEEHIKRKWADLAGEDSAEQYTPSDIIALISDVTTSYLEQYDKDINLKIYDMTCGGGNMLFGVEDNIERTYNQKGKKSPYMITYGQEYETSLYALAKIESRFRTESHIGYGNTLTQDQFPDTKMNIIVANPPYGTDWKHEKKAIEADETGRFVYKPGIGDGQMLFLEYSDDSFIE